MNGIYNSFKLFHYSDKLNSLEKGKDVLPPIHIRLKPTNICNHNCWYCSYRFDEVQLGKDMNLKDQIPYDKMMEIADDIVDMKVKAVTFSGGGEPLIYPHLKEVLKKFIRGNVKFATLTNGYFLKDELADLFAEHGSWVRVSMDGWDDKSYKEYRGKAHYSQIIKNMEDFAKRKSNCYLGVSFIIDNKNYDKVYQQIKIYKEIGVNSVKLSPTIISNNGIDNNKYHKPIYDEVESQINRAIKDFMDDDFVIFNSYHLLDEKFEKEYSWCPYIQVLPVIGGDSNVYSCHDKAYNLDSGLLGSLKNQSFKDFWMDNKEKFYTINPKKECNHHCVVNKANLMVHEYLAVDPDHKEFV